MVDWQTNLTNTLQKANASATVTTSEVHPHGNNHGMMMETEHPQKPSSNISSSNNTITNEVSISEECGYPG